MSWGQWHDGLRYSIRVWTDGRDTYPNDFKCMVEVKETTSGESVKVKGHGKYIGNFSPIWIRWGRGSLQLTEILRLSEDAPEFARMVVRQRKRHRGLGSRAFEAARLEN